jgi:hypothetical protein
MNRRDRCGGVHVKPTPETEMGRPGDGTNGVANPTLSAAKVTHDRGFAIDPNLARVVLGSPRVRGAST